MQDNFNLAKYLRHGNKLLNENIGGYVDLKPLKEMDFNEMDSTEDGVFSITLDTATDLNKIKMYAKSKGISVNVVNPEGPAGGWPEVEYTGSKEALEGFIDKFFPQDADDTKSEIMPVDGNMNELNDLGMTKEDKNSMSLEELMGTAMEIDELEKPKSIYATDDSEDEKGFDVPGDDDDFVDGFEETRENAQRAFVDAIESLRQMSFEDDDIIDMFKTAFYGK
jgi:hypothetical protein